MTDLESRLHAVLGADAPPARDALFRLNVLVRRERARFRRQIMLTVAAVLVVAIVVALNVRALESWIGADPGRLVVVSVLGAVAVASLPGSPFAALPGVRTFAQRVGRWFFA